MQTEVPAEQSEAEKAPAPKQAPRGFVAEWVVTILIMLFASTSLAWSYVIPTGSMEDTLMVGDHIIVDKLAYAPSGASSASTCCPMRSRNTGTSSRFDSRLTSRRCSSSG